MGIGIGGFRSNMRTITLKRADGTVVGTINRSCGKDKKKMKKSGYNFKGFSAQLMRTKTSVNAGQLVVRAREQIAVLRRKLSTGDYDEEELRNAIMHAEQMARIAKKRMKHLKEEEDVKDKGAYCETDWEKEDDAEMQSVLEEMPMEDIAEISREEMEQMMRELQNEMEELMKEVEEESGLEDLDELVPAGKTNMDALDLEKLKKKHRAEELREILEADMKYLKAVFDRLAKEKQKGASFGGSDGGSSSDAGVSLEIGGMEMPVSAPEVSVAVEGASLDQLV